MKVCIVCDYLPEYHDTWGGGEKASISIARLLASKGEAVSVVTKKPNKPVKELFKHYSLRTTEDFLGSKAGLYFSRFKSIWVPFDLITYFSALKLFRRIKPDIISLGNFRELSLSVVLAAHKLNIPVVYSVYDYWLFCPKIDLVDNNGSCSANCNKCISGERFGSFKRLLVPLRNFIFNRISFDRVIALSDNSRQLIARHGVNKNKLRVVPLPFGDLKTDLKSRVDPNLILFMGWVHHRKGLKILVQAMNLLAKSNPKARLVALGMPADKSYETAVRSIMGGNVELVIGRKPLDEVKKLVARAGIIVIPEQWANMSPVLLIESMFNAKPIIASRVGGIPSFIKHGESGLLACHDKPDDFARQIKLLLDSPSLAKRFGLKAREQALDKFNKNKVYFKLMSVYGGLLKQKA
ncbi:MAG: glycosyltransferase family 4 protein [Candidatus Nanoarchaeia archaeon]|jgi:glycosyltransferase involved in cell wall biosynthesis